MEEETLKQWERALLEEKQTDTGPCRRTSSPTRKPRVLFSVGALDNSGQLFCMQCVAYVPIYVYS
jgi:hypothetical protein